MFEAQAQSEARLEQGMGPLVTLVWTLHVSIAVPLEHQMVASMRLGNPDGSSRSARAIRTEYSPHAAPHRR